MAPGASQMCMLVQSVAQCLVWRFPPRQAIQPETRGAGLGPPPVLVARAVRALRAVLSTTALCAPCCGSQVVEPNSGAEAAGLLPTRRGLGGIVAGGPPGVCSSNYQGSVGAGINTGSSSGTSTGPPAPAPSACVCLQPAEPPPVPAAWPLHSASPLPPPRLLLLWGS